MNVISNEDAVSFLSENNSLLDSKLTSLHVDEKDQGLQIELILSGRSNAVYKSIELVFYQVLEFEFSHADDYVFGNVERVKFLTTQDGFYYLSLDPDERSLTLSDNDKDFVLARSVAASVIDKREK